MELKAVALLAFLNALIQAAQAQTSDRSLCTCHLTNGTIDTSVTESGYLASTGFYTSLSHAISQTMGRIVNSYRGARDLGMGISVTPPHWRRPKREELERRREEYRAKLGKGSQKNRTID
ncbi:hypothetical protein DFH09DRAFT_1085903 [Mycena vulgaris]|nr:hypothetical protein DFH09DRAFT_1085903 [Mycena vulgaris]